MTNGSLFMNEPSMQLTQDLRDAVADALSTRRPILHHLSADTAWLLQIPRPPQATRRGGKLYFNILIDPWLSGTQIDYSGWFSKQWHSVPPSVPTIAAVEELIREVETLACAPRSGKTRKSYVEEVDELEEHVSFIDAVVVSHEFTDHCHEKTLLQVHPDVPVFATEKAVELIKSWNHFRSIQCIPHFSKNPDWRATSMMPLPEWLGISRLVTNNEEGLYLHSALMIAFNNKTGKQSRKGRGSAEQDEDEAAEALIYTPHGIRSESDDVRLVASAAPPIRTLAFLHGLEYITLARQPLNLGAHNGLQAQRILQAKYWIGTHDENKPGTGIVGWLLRRNKISVQEAVNLEAERRRKQDASATNGIMTRTTDVVGSFSGVNWRDLGNGESLVLN